MDLEFKTKDEVINFFQSRHGYINVIQICELLVSHNNIQAQEIEHIKQHLHELKQDGFLLIRNEGEDIYHEEFASTPERVSRYLISKTTVEVSEEVFKLNPEFYGIGINLRLAWKKIKNFFKKQ